MRNYKSSKQGQDATTSELIGKPVGDNSFPAGYAATAEILSELKTEELAVIYKLAGEVMQNSLMMKSLSDRVYQLMLEDLHHQQQRRINYKGSY